MPTKEHITLDPEDEGEPGAPFGATGFQAQDEAFCAAMRKAIARGKEKVEEGVKTAPGTDVRYVRQVRVPTHVRTASTSYYD